MFIINVYYKFPIMLRKFKPAFLHDSHIVLNLLRRFSVEKNAKVLVFHFR
jgi:hypothetical protein